MFTFNTGIISVINKLINYFSITFNDNHSELKSLLVGFRSSNLVTPIPLLLLLIIDHFNIRYSLTDSITHILYLY